MRGNFYEKNDVAVHRGQARFLEPPRSHVGDEMKSLVAVCELALVNEKSGVGSSGVDGLLDLIEGNYHRNEIRLKKS